MTANDRKARDIAIQIIALRDLWQTSEGMQGCEDIEDAICAIADQGGEIADLAQSLLDVESSREEDIADDAGGAWLWSCYRMGLLDVAPDAVPGEDGCATDCIYWSGFGSESAIRAAVRS